MSSISTTRGRSFDPAESAAQRLNEVRLEQEREREGHRKAMRDYGRLLDEVEACYRQHNPPQIRFAEQMAECPGFFDPHIGDCRYL